MEKKTHLLILKNGEKPSVSSPPQVMVAEQAPCPLGLDWAAPLVVAPWLVPPPAVVRRSPGPVPEPRPPAPPSVQSALSPAPPPLRSCAASRGWFSWGGTAAAVAGLKKATGARELSFSPFIVGRAEEKNYKNFKPAYWAHRNCLVSILLKQRLWWTWHVWKETPKKWSLRILDIGKWVPNAMI